MRAEGTVIVVTRTHEDLEDALAIAEYARRQAAGTPGDGMSHEEVGRMLGIRCAHADEMAATRAENS
ncbi:hypothetical protein [Streptomyces boninensis]|uniref:hypothetical protein n=1 Tax=Streptomyces boninensis TaxID=2039455 RepID=UPI003B223A6B